MFVYNVLWLTLHLPQYVSVSPSAPVSPNQGANLCPSKYQRDATLLQDLRPLPKVKREADSL